MTSAGTIDPALDRHLSTLGPAENVSVLVMLADQAPIADLDQELLANRATLPVRHERVIQELRAVADATQPALLADLASRRAAGEVRGFTPYWIGNLVVAQMTAKAVREVAARPDVGIVYANFSVSLIEPVGGVPIAPPLPDDGQGALVNAATPGLRAINAHRVWAELGITGAGRLVCGLDTGVMGNHVALASRWRGTHVPAAHAWKDVLGGGTQFPHDTGGCCAGHGTHTMGTMVGLGVATGDTVGVAFGAEWIACNAINQGVSTEFDNDVIAAFQWIADPDGNAQTVDDVPDVVQNSWRINEGFPGGYTDCDIRWWAVIDAVEAAGCAVVFSAGNEGPTVGTIGSPPDRITTPTNGFAIGAVDAQQGIPFPFPIANFSSRGPSGCPGTVTQKIKPEVVGPGVEVYSTLNTGGYGSAGFSGTSMAGPHVSGIIALMREADPNLPVTTMKQVIMDTARNLGPPGEDNSFGWGIPDAFEAVSSVMEGIGQISGTVVREGSLAGGSTPIAGVTVTVVGTGRSFLTNAQGNFSGFAPHGTHNVTASHPAYQSETVNGVVISDSPVVVNFSLLPVPDAVPPAISHTCPFASESQVGPYEVSATVTDNLGVVDTVVLNYRVGGPFITVAMSPTGNDRYAGSIPGQPFGTTVEYYIEARDIQQNVGLDPPAAPLAVHHLIVDTPTTVVIDDAELDRGWTLGVGGDQATTGRWVRENPVGTSNPSPPYIGQPEDDHTPNPGVICFITGNAPPGSAVGMNDVDGGCTTLLSPIYDLTGAHEAVVHYWRWYTNETTLDDIFSVDISSDGGTTWQPFERVGPGTVQPWLEVGKALRCQVDLTSQMRFRFVACDLGSGSITEAGIDDFSLGRFESPTTAVSPEAAPAAALRIVAVRPNPFNPAALVTYEVPRKEAVQLKIFDVAGRLLKTLADGVLEPGVHSSLFDGRAADGQELASGVYFLELSAGGQRLTKKVSLVR
jgi:subtilisin family serine protease